MTRKKVNVVTLGCSKNLVDSEKLMEQIRLGGYEVVHDAPAGSAEIVIINTCGFIGDAREESIDTILQFTEQKKRGVIDTLYVTGCMAERYRDELIKEIPEADRYFGVHHLKEILSELKSTYRDEYAERRVLTGPGHYAYMKVSEGCDRTCSFCAIPLIRGSHTSRPLDEILSEARYLAEKGVRELILVAQDLTFYGMDIYGERRIATLVEKLAEPAAFSRIRLHYLYPSGFPESLIPVIRDIPSVCNYLDIPIQHISNRVLKMMNRSHTAAYTVSLLEKLRRKIPAAAMRTTLIVGHPGEGEKEFRELYDFVCDFRFDRLGVFAYSHEENTPAARKYNDNTSDGIKKERVAALMELQQEISAGLNAAMVGETVRVMFDRREGEWMIGRTDHDSPEIDQEVLVPYSDQLPAGSLHNVTITDSGVFDLIGKIQDDPLFS